MGITIWKTLVVTIVLCFQVFIQSIINKKILKKTLPNPRNKYKYTVIEIIKKTPSMGATLIFCLGPNLFQFPVEFPDTPSPTDYKKITSRQELLKY